MAIDEHLLNIKLKNEFKDVFKADSDKALKENIQTSLAMAAFVEKKVTLAMAAELADKGLSDFIKMLTRYNIPWMEYTEDSLDEDLQVLEELRSNDNEEGY